MKKRLFFWGCVLAVVLTVLAGCHLFGLGDEFKVSGGIIRISPSEADPAITVSDADDNPISNASVSVDGTTLGYDSSNKNYSCNPLPTSDNATHTLNVICNSKTVTASVTIPHIPTLTVPSPYTAAQNQIFSYTTGAAPERLRIACSSNGETYTQDIIPGSINGNFTVPANTFQAGQSVVYVFTAFNESAINGLEDSSFEAAALISGSFTTQ